MPVIIWEGPDEFVDLGKRAVGLCDARWPGLLKKDITLSFVDAIPNAPEWAQGLWRGGQRHGFIKNMRRKDGRPKSNLIQYLSIHEGLGHPSDQDRMDGKRGPARRLMIPRPDGWRDTDAFYGMEAYWHYPFECYANRLVEALTGGAIRSPYDDDYTRWIPDADLPKLLELPLASGDMFAAEADNGGPPEDIIEPPPDPRYLEALNRLHKARRLFREGVEVTEGWQALIP